MIVALQCCAAVRVRSDHRDCLQFLLVERKDSVVLEENEALLCDAVLEGQVLRAFHLRCRDRIIFRFVEHAEQEPRREQAHRRLCDVLLIDHAGFVRVHDPLIGAAAVHIRAVLKSENHGLLRSLRDLVILVEILDCPTVGHEVALESPVFAKDFLQRFRAAADLSVRAVVGTHHGLNLSLFYSRLKCRKIGLFHVLLRGDGIEMMALRLGSRVHRKMLCTRGGLHVFATLLHAFDEIDAHSRREEWVLAVGLVASAPARIAENIHVRCPERKSLINVAVAAAALEVVLCSSFVCDDAADLLQRFLVKGRCHADRLREHRGNARARDPVQCLIPPVVRRNPQPLDRGCVKTQLRGLLLDGHLPDELLGALSCFFSGHCHPSGRAPEPGPRSFMLLSALYAVVPVFLFAG